MQLIFFYYICNCRLEYSFQNMITDKIVRINFMYVTIIHHIEWKKFSIFYLWLGISLQKLHFVALSKCVVFDFLQIKQFTHAPILPKEEPLLFFFCCHTCTELLQNMDAFDSLKEIPWQLLYLVFHINTVSANMRTIPFQYNQCT